MAQICQGSEASKALKGTKVRWRFLNRPTHLLSFWVGQEGRPQGTAALQGFSSPSFSSLSLGVSHDPIWDPIFRHRLVHPSLTRGILSHHLHPKEEDAQLSHTRSLGEVSTALLR